MEQILKENQTALHGISGNFPVPGIGKIMKTVCFPTGKDVYHGPTDKMVQKAAHLISNPSGVRDLLSEGIFISDNAEDRIRQLNDALPLAVEADKAASAARKAKRDLTPEEQALVDRVTAMADKIVQVDVFDKLGVEKYEDESYIRPAIRGTRFEPLEKGLQERVAEAAMAKQAAKAPLKQAAAVSA